MGQKNHKDRVGLSSYLGITLPSLGFSQILFSLTVWLRSMDFCTFQYKTPKQLYSCFPEQFSLTYAEDRSLWAVAYMCILNVETAGQGLDAGFSLANSSSPAASNELCDIVLFLPFSRGNHIKELIYAFTRLFTNMFSQPYRCLRVSWKLWVLRRFNISILLLFFFFSYKTEIFEVLQCLSE